MSGGGAVYHDFGNLNFSFHTLSEGNDFMDFSQFTAPVLKLLNDRNVPAKLEGRNDLLIEGKKFSGNAKLAKNGKMIQHGTILFNSDMSILDEVLKINPLKYIDKAIKSNRSRVTNLIDYLPSNSTTGNLKKILIDEIVHANPNSLLYELTSEDLKGVEYLIKNKYETWDWNFGSSPNYNFKNAKKVPAGFIEIHLNVEKGIIQEAKIFGDFFASESIENFERQLIGHKHNQNELQEILKQLDLTKYFGKVTSQEILEVLI